MIKKIILIVCACLLSSLNFVGVKALDTSNENLIGVLELDFKFYYSYTGTTASRHIVQLLHVTLDCTVESTYRSFNGSLFVHLETNYKVHYILNGAFYNTGTKTNSAGLSLGIGKSATITLGASSTTNFYDGIYAEGNLWTARQ